MADTIDDEIKRYEDFTTTDWVIDAKEEQARRRRQLEQPQGVKWKTYVGYLRAQGWVMLLIIGIIIGILSATLNLVSEWLSGLKNGFCSRYFYLNEDFCTQATRDDWKLWSQFSILRYIIYIILSGLFAFISALFVKIYAPTAAGSGISEIKCIIAGFQMKSFLNAPTLIIKAIGLPLAIGSGLSVGKEGPSVHYAVCVGNVVANWSIFKSYIQQHGNASKIRDILTACSAAGVAVAFGSPIGGVVFSIEEMSSKFSHQTMWKSYFCALIATWVLSCTNPFRNGQLVTFQVQYDRDWHFFELPFFIILGIFGGLYGIIVIKYNLWMSGFRRNYLSLYPIHEAVGLAIFTSIICYFNPFLRYDMTKTMGNLFREYNTNTESEFDDDDIFGLYTYPHGRFWVASELFFATIIRSLLVIITYGSKVPAGIFVPSMAVGAYFGRMIGIIVESLHQSYPHSSFFATCRPNEPCITPGTYAFLGAGSALCGIMHITVTVVVIMFELTGALNYILPTMIVVGVTKAITDHFGCAKGIADEMIYFNGFPFLDNKHEPDYGGTCVSMAMIPVDKVEAFWQEMTLGQVDDILSHTNVKGFPITSNNNGIIIGYISRSGLEDCIKGHQDDDDLEKPISFIQTNQQGVIDVSSVVDESPICVDGGTKLETCFEIFQRIGPRAILIENQRNGKLIGIVCAKDVLRYQFGQGRRHHQAKIAKKRDSVSKSQQWIYKNGIKLLSIFQITCMKISRWVKLKVRKRQRNDIEEEITSLSSY